jgi:hypothetical protein
LLRADRAREKRVGGEHIEIDSDSLVGVVGKPIALDAVEGAICQPFPEVARGQPLAPSKAKHLP